jgi:hypothetical protein
MAALAIAASAPAAVSDAEELTRFGGIGEEAGQLRLPFGTASDPTTGHVYTVEEGANNRVSEFTPWGGFVKAFGWDVAPGPVNEQQEVRVRAGDGQFRLTFGSDITGDLDFDAPGRASEGAGSVEAALNALPSIGAAGASVSAESVPGTTDGETPFIYVVAFKGSLAGSNVAQLVATDGATSLSGGVPTTSLEVRTRAEGTSGGAGLESCTGESGCKAGLAGEGAGELDDGRGIALDRNGNVYVREVGNKRVQKFDSAGNFVAMFGGEVNKTTNENLCTALSGDECSVGIAGSGNGQFGDGNSSGIAFCRPGALCPAGALFVADRERVQRFSLQGEYESQLPADGLLTALAFDPVSEDLYTAFEDGEDVFRLDASTGAELGTLLAGSGAIATDSTGSVFTADDGQVLQFDSTGKPHSPPGCCKVPTGFRLSGLGTNLAGDLYVASFAPGVDSFIRSFGPAPVMFEAPPPVPPSVVSQFASSVERSGALLETEINPHFFTDTHYYLEYGTGRCSEGGCEERKPFAPGAILTSKVIDAPVRSAGVFLQGLEPGTTYHYRFVAESSGGGPVRGVGGGEGVDGEENTFTTYPPAPSPKADCPNRVFRSGASIHLPDCRVFEMVSPIDKNNGDIKGLIDSIGYDNALDQSSSSGDKLTYSSYRAFADPKAAPYINQYIADRRDGVGWFSKAIDPPQGPDAAITPNGVPHFSNPYKAFSEDLCHGWLVVTEPALAPEALEGQPDLFRHDDCAGESNEALIQAQPIGEVGPESFNPEMQGASSDGAEAILRVRGKLTAEAASGAWQAYYSRSGELSLLCVLPSGLPSGGNCSGGTGGVPTPASVNLTDLHRLPTVARAISADGSRVYWTDSGSAESGPGKVYLRLNPGEEQSELDKGVCTEADKACTVKVSETASTKASRFLTATPDGTKALFEVTEGLAAGDLYEFNLKDDESTLIAKRVGPPGQGGEPFAGLLGASEDLSYIYFASTAALADGAVKDRPNLYLAHQGTTSFIATLSDTDVTSREVPSNTSPEPIYHAARVSPDGRHLAFISTEPLTGYDNTDQVTGEADSEVFLYGAGTAEPVCASCNPSGARPRGRVVKVVENSTGRLPAAATIPPAQFSLHLPRSLSRDGRSLFFNSYDPLLPRDTNTKADAYVWQAADGAKDCEEKGAELYVPNSEGCLSLISSGQSPTDSEFLDAGSNGRDVFFTTNASLLPQDVGLIDVYDARAGGGLPAPPEPPGPCQGEVCQGAIVVPDDPDLASASFEGARDPRRKVRRPCVRRKAAGKRHCVAGKRKRPEKRGHRGATGNNRGGRR